MPKPNPSNQSLSGKIHEECKNSAYFWFAETHNVNIRCGDCFIKTQYYVIQCQNERITLLGVFTCIPGDQEPFEGHNLHSYEMLATSSGSKS